MKLILGNKNYSSWSLRPWILLKHFGIPFTEVVIPLYEGNYKARILKYSKNGKVPILIHGPVTVWESLAICQYAADLFPKRKMWPQGKPARALAYSVCQEMHAGFTALRTAMPMNLTGLYPGEGLTPEVKKDIQRIEALWAKCRAHARGKGPFLFGHFTIADAMFAPVVTRFRTYGVKLSRASADYSKAILTMPAFAEWEQAAIKEPWIIRRSEIYAKSGVKT